jgi:hypothetical protein
LKGHELAAIGAWLERYNASQPVGSQPLREVEQSLATLLDVHHEQAAIAGLQAEFGKTGAPNNELLLLLQGVIPEEIQARDAKTNAPIFDRNGEPVYLTCPVAKFARFSAMYA